MAESPAVLTELLDELEQAYAQRDLPALVALFAHDAQVTAFGTEVAEKCVGLDEVEAQFLRDWARFDSASFVHTWVASGESNGVVWAAADLQASASTSDGDWTGPLRATVVAIPEDGALRIVHWHLSAPSGADDISGD